MKKRLIWIFPDRGSSQQTAIEHKYFWDEYAAAAAAENFLLQVISPELIDIVYRPGLSADVFIKDEKVCPTNTIFVTELYTFPYQQKDILTQITTFASLQMLGFYLPISPDLSVITNDKLATFLFFQKAGLKTVPCVRVTAGRDLDEHDLQLLLTDLTFPLILKPANWGGGLGINLARNWSELHNILGLARGADCTMLLQPKIGSQSVVDYRVYFVRGKPHTILTRAPQEGEIIGNATRGGRAEIVEMPSDLLEPAMKAAAFIDLPYFCVDFLYDGDTYWLSEVELDGAISGGYLDKGQAHALLKARFNAYNEIHEQWLQLA